MRILGLMSLAVLAIAAVSAAAPAQAQTYDPGYPVCLQVFGQINYIDCRYTSMPQCAGMASGRSAQCIVNPYFAGAREARPIRRTHRRHHAR